MLEYSNTKEISIARSKIDLKIYELQAAISKTLAHPIRLAILHTLKDGEKTVNELTQIIGASQSNISQHLALMRQREIVKTRKDRTNIFYSVADPKISIACYTIREVLHEQLKQKQEMANQFKSHN